MELFKTLQEDVAASIFTAPASYDGRKNVFSMYELALGPSDSKTVRVLSISHTSQDSTFYLSSSMCPSHVQAQPRLGPVLQRFTK